MVSRRKSRADRRHESYVSPPLERRRAVHRDVGITVLEKNSNIGIILKNELVALNMSPLQQILREQIKRSTISRVVINLQHVPYMDTSSIGMLVETHKELDKNGKHLILVNLQPELRRFLDMLNLDSFFDIRQIT